MNRETLDKFFERGILAFLLVILVFAPLAFGAVDAWEFLVVQGLTMGVMILWALRLGFSPKPQLLWPPVCWVVLAFLVYPLGRYLTADIEYVARQETLQVIVIAVVFFATVNNLYRQEAAQTVSVALIGVGVAEAGYALFQYLKHSNHVWNDFSNYPGRASGTYLSPNNLAGFLELVLPLALAFLLVGRMKIIFRILLGYAIIMIGTGLTVTFSRGGWVAAVAGVVGLLLALTTHKNHRWRALGFLTLLTAAGIFVGAHFMSKPAPEASHVTTPALASMADLAIRLKLWEAADHMWMDHFWWGAGPGHFDYRFREYRPAIIQLDPDRTHNDYLNLLVDWGLVGGLIVLAGIAAYACGLVRTWPHVRRSENDFGSGQSNRFAFYLGAAAGLLALAVHSTVDFNLHVPANALIAAVLLALLTSNLRFATESYWVNLRWPLRALTTTVLALLLIYLGAQEWRLGNETRWLLRAEKYPELFSPERQAALENAFAVEPKNFQTAYNIGEMLRAESFTGGDNYEKQANEAMVWFAKSIQLNPFYAYSYLRTGMCLDWLDKHDEAEKFMDRAEQLDPNGYYIVANIGWHYVQAGDYAAARQWFLRSLSLDSENNSISHTYLDLVEQKLQDKASGRPTLPAGF
jgi:O-antigen ligase